MTPLEYNDKALKEMRVALVGPGGHKVPANRERDLSRLARRFENKRDWRGEIPKLAAIWAKVIFERASSEKRKKQKGRPRGILTWREREFADTAVAEVWAIHRLLKSFSEVSVLAAPNPRKRGLTEFREEVFLRAMALALEHKYHADRMRMIEEIRKRLREPEPHFNYLAWDAASPRRTLNKA